MARLESNISNGLTFKFDGNKDKLGPWIKKFCTLHTNAVWQKATYVIIDSKSYNLLIDFTMISKVHIQAQASIHWTAENQIKSLKVEYPELFYPCILGTVVIKSVTDESTLHAELCWY